MSKKIRIGWLKSGTGIKRWLLVGSLGVLAISGGMMGILGRALDLLETKTFWIGVGMIVLGILAIYIGVTYILNMLLGALSRAGGTSMNLTMERGITDMMYEKRVLQNAPSVVVLGGGTGLSTLLRGIKQYTSNVTAIVTVADDGGGSGTLRKDMGIIPPGDIRNCIVALSDMQPTMEALMQYRFTEGQLKGQSFGNVFIAAMNQVTDGFMDALNRMQSVLAMTGRVLPVTLENVQLCAQLQNGQVVSGESEIPRVVQETGCGIEKVMLNPPNSKTLQEVIEAIYAADIIVMGPGSLFTSVLPDLIVPGVTESIRNSGALKIYAANMMTQPGETDNYTVSDHVRVILQHCGVGAIDVALCNGNFKVPPEIMKRYHGEKSELVALDESAVRKLGVDVCAEDLMLYTDGFVRHSSEKLAHAVFELYKQWQEGGFSLSGGHYK